MNYKEIDILKSVFADIMRNQNILRSTDLGLDGRLMAVGYSPFWTGRNDSKIEKIELNLMSSRGIMVPLILKNIINYELHPEEGRRNMRNKVNRINAIELIMLSPYNSPARDIFDRVKFEVIYDE